MHCLRRRRQRVPRHKPPSVRADVELIGMRYSLTSAREHFNNGNYKEAMTHYLIILSQIPKSEVDQYGHEFVNCINSFFLSNLSTKANLKNVASPVIALFPGNPIVHTALAYHLTTKEMKSEAYKVYDSLLKSRPDLAEELTEFRIIRSNLSTAAFDSWHMIMLNNKLRNAIYEKAISHIPEGTLTLEIGSGTGLLSVFAHWHNLDIIAVEESEDLANITRKALEVNDLKNGRLKHVAHCNSTNFDILSHVGKKADALISEIFDCSAFGEGIIKTFHDAHERLLNPGAIIIPEGFTVYVQLVQSQTLRNVHSWDNFRTSYVMLGDNLPVDPYWCDSLENYPDAVLLSDPFELITVDLTSIEDLKERMKPWSNAYAIPTTKDGVIHAIVAFWRANMGNGLCLESNMKGSCWDYGIFPVRDPHPVKAGEFTNICANICYEGKRLDVFLYDEYGKKGGEKAFRVVNDYYLNICSDLGFTRMVDNDIKDGESKILAMNPFNWNHSKKLRDFKVMPLDEITKQYFTATCLVKSDMHKLEPDRIIIWPLYPDGSLNDEAILKFLPLLVSQWKAGYASKTPKITPSALTCRGQLVYSDSLDQKCRLQPEAHLKAQLRSPSYPMSLFECRDIYWQNFEHKVLSDPFRIMKFDLQWLAEHPPTEHDSLKQTRITEIFVKEDGEVDGVLYWWTAKSFSSRDLVCASFVFDKRVPVKKGEKLRIRVDMYNCQLLISLEP